jgi:hypothetical protein
MKHQTRPLNQDGSFVNNLMGNNTTTPVVGEMCTICGYSDRKVYEVIAVSEDGAACTVRRVKTSRTGNRDMSEMQTYEYTSNPNGHTMELMWSQRKGQDTGKWVQVSHTIEFAPAVRRAAKEAGHYFITDVLTPEQNEAVYAGSQNGQPANVVPGITKAKKIYYDVSVVFGDADEYFDFSF